jgi:hypothetical protein
VRFRGPAFPRMCARSQKGKFTVHVKTTRKRFRAGLKAIAEWCQKHRHEPVDAQQKTLNSKLHGHYQCYGRPTNYRKSPAVLSGRPPDLEARPESPHTRAMADVETI